MMTDHSDIVLLVQAGLPQQGVVLQNAQYHGRVRPGSPLSSHPASHLGHKGEEKFEKKR